MQILLALGLELVAALYLLAIMMLIGAAAFHFLVWRRTSLPQGPVRDAADDEMFSLVTSCGTWSALALLLLCGPRAVGVSSLLDDRFSLSSRLAALVLRTEWGLGLLAMVLAACVSLIGYLAIARRRAGGWPFVLLGVLLLAIGTGLQGHPGDAFSQLTAAPLFDGLHAVSIGAWLGTFFLLVLAERRLPAHTSSPWTDPLGAMMERYFRVGGALVTVVLLTGLFSVATHLNSFDDIGGTLYGRLIGGKVGIFIILLGFTEYHRRHAERQARTSERPRLVHTLRFQAGLILLILALTSILIDTTPPGMNDVRSEVFRTSPKGSVESADVEIKP